MPEGDSSKRSQAIHKEFERRQHATFQACPKEVLPFLDKYFEKLYSFKRAIERRGALHNQLEVLQRQQETLEPRKVAKFERLRIELDAADQTVEVAKAEGREAEKSLIERWKEHRIRLVPPHRREEAFQLLEEEQRDIQALQKALEPFFAGARVDWERMIDLGKERDRITAQIAAEYNQRLSELADAP